jgi:hypothetical protein
MFLCSILQHRLMSFDIYLNYTYIFISVFASLVQVKFILLIADLRWQIKFEIDRLIF